MEEPKPAGEGEHVVEAGDSITSIAIAAGHLPDSLWNADANAALKQARADGELLMPGDRVTVLEPRRKDVACATGRRHVFRRIAAPCKFSVILEDSDGTPLAGKKYELKIGDATLTGTTDDAGKIECSVDPAARTGTLQVWLEEPGFPDPWIHELRLGSLQPKNSVAGMQQRLANLGLYTGALNGELDEATLAALAAFAAAQQLSWTGQPEQALVDKLVEVHRV